MISREWYIGGVPFGSKSDCNSFRGIFVETLMNTVFLRREANHVPSRFFFFLIVQVF